MSSKNNCTFSLQEIPKILELTFLFMKHIVGKHISRHMQLLKHLVVRWQYYQYTCAKILYAILF